MYAHNDSGISLEQRLDLSTRFGQVCLHKAAKGYIVEVNLSPGNQL